MKIKYETDGAESFCITPCPHGEKRIYFRILSTVLKVGSMQCYECEYFCSDDDKNKTVECRKDEDKYD
jgi:hypothetical protein